MIQFIQKTKKRKHADCHTAFDRDSLLSQIGKSKSVKYEKLLKNVILLTFCKRKSTMSVF